MTIPNIQNSFVAGELAPSLFGRTDLAKYRLGCSTLRNCFVNYQGGASSRAGLAYIGTCKQPTSAAPPRDIRFQFNINQGYALEFGDQYMRIKFDGAYVTESSKNISAVTQANPGVVTATSHGYSNGDYVYISGVGGMVELDGLIWKIANVTTNTFTLIDMFGNAVNTISYPAYTSGGTAARIYTVVSPYAAVDLPYLKFTQSADTMTLTCVNTSTLTEYFPYQLQRLGNTNWVFTQVSFASVISPPRVVTATGINTVTTRYTFYSYRVTAVDVNGNESVASINADCQNNDIGITQGSNIITWSAVTGAVYYKIYGATPVSLLSSNDPDPGFVGVPYGFIGRAFGLQFVDTNIIPDFATPPPTHNNPFARGTITNVIITAGGSGLSQTTVQYSITTSTGSGFSGTPIVQNGNLVGFIIEDGGANYANADTITILTGGVAATGTYTFTGNPTVGQTIVLNGVTWTFETTISGASQTKIQASLAATLAQLANDLASSNNNSLIVASYSITTGTVLNITYDTLGTVGNAYTLASGTYGGVVSGATLSGGTNGTTSGATATLTVGAQTGTYPSVVSYYQQRLGYADTLNQPDTYFFSQPGLYNNMDDSIPITAGDAITGTPWGQQINGIQWMIQMPNGLIVLTGNGGWLLSGVGGGAFDATSQFAVQQANVGSSALVPPILINSDILYVQSKNSIVRDLTYNFFTNIYVGDDKTILANHLFFGHTIIQWAYSEEPYKVIWAVRDDGILLSFTWLKEQDIWGWARHDTDGLVVGVCTVTEPPVDAVYVIVKRYVQGKWLYYSERMDNRIWATVEDCFCVDSGLSYPMPTPNATLTPTAAAGTNNISSVLVINGGSGYTAPTAVAVDSTGVGTGATFSVTLSAGVVTAITPLMQGTKYTAGLTSVVITDSTGSGAVAQAVITNYVTFNASASVFGSGNVGSILRVGGGIATIVSQTGTACVANITQPITEVVTDDPNSMPIPAVSGNWTMTAPTTSVSGLNNLNGLTVSILADGSVVPNQVVTNNSITLPHAASAITVGVPFLPQIQSMPLDMQSHETIQGKRKNIYNATIIVANTRGISVGSNQPDASFQPDGVNVPWTNMIEVKERNALNVAGSAIPLFSGQYFINIPANWATQGQLAIQQNYPLPMNILGVVINSEIGDTIG
jgi:hypothetical protein